MGSWGMQPWLFMSSKREEIMKTNIFNYLNAPFDHEGEVDVYCLALYFAIIRLANKLNWKKEFGLPTDATMEHAKIGSKTKYYATLKKLQQLGLITITSKGNRANQATKVVLFKSTLTSYYDTNANSIRTDNKTVKTDDRDLLRKSLSKEGNAKSEIFLTKNSVFAEIEKKTNERPSALKQSHELSYNGIQGKDEYKAKLEYYHKATGIPIQDILNAHGITDTNHL